MGGGADGETPLARQGSIYSLTFDEFQSTLGGLGKDLGSMNVDELLKNIWNAEESYAIAATLGEGGGGAGGAPGLQRQGSLTLPRTLSHKTVDEVWRGFVDASSSGQGPVVGGSSYVTRQPTLGEMTLEEFLVRAGVAREELTPPPVPPRPADTKINTTSVFFGDLPTISSSIGLSVGFNRANQSNGNVANAPIPHSSAVNFGMTVTAARPYAAPMPLETGVDMGNPQGMRGGGLVSFGDAGMDNQLMKGMVGLGTAGVVTAKGSPATHLSPDVLGKANGDLSSVSPAPYTVNSGMRGRKHSGAVEKVIERRQKRMIKNRESAARSRARKQAYTMELEAEVAKLKEQNQELQKKQFIPLIFTGIDYCVGCTVTLACGDVGNAEESGLADDQSAKWTKETVLEEDTNGSMVKAGLDNDGLHWNISYHIS
ncbi:unnamed protein product [Musa hybrid cultivar]